MKTFVPIQFEDLDMPAEDLKLIADGAAVFLPTRPDPEDDEKLIDDARPDPEDDEQLLDAPAD